MKRNLLILAAVLLPLLCASASKKEIPLEELKAKAESTNSDQKSLLYVEVVRRQVEDANQLYIAGDVEKAQNTVKEAVSYAEKARDAALSRPHKLKDTEIHLRLVEHRLNDIRRTLALEDQPDVQAASEQIASIRKQLLAAMFSPKHKK
ncbi:MAG TPA: hypothetical protein VE825_15140 [Terriglobales bacterium]|nr:hypothetical protein [Terriglobales bacterium]